MSNWEAVREACTRTESCTRSLNEKLYERNTRSPSIATRSSAAAKRWAQREKLWIISTATSTGPSSDHQQFRQHRAVFYAAPLHNRHHSSGTLSPGTFARYTHSPGTRYAHPSPREAAEQLATSSAIHWNEIHFLHIRKFIVFCYVFVPRVCVR